MTETQFIIQNENDWTELEQLLKNPGINANRLQDLFVKVSGDLAFAKTYFPNRSVRVYLNLLTQRVFDSLNKQKTDISFKSFVEFFTSTLPIELYRSRKALLFSLVFFIAMMVIGAVSTAYHEDFARVILGDNYVSMTEENINAGDPMAVYKDANKTDMFLGITINNIRVSFLTYILGIFASLGTIIILMYNGIMVGTFQFFFYKKGLFLTSFLTIWIHGTIEISAIIIAGAAGIILGSGLLFPKTYSRLVSLQISAIRSLKILLSTVPLFFIAGFLESFITRQTDLPTVVKAVIIGLSLLFILYIYWFYPRRVARRLDYNPSFYDTDRLPSKSNLDPIGSHNLTEVLLRTITDYGNSLSIIIKRWIGPALLVFVVSTYLSLQFLNGLIPDISREVNIYCLSILCCVFVQYKLIITVCNDARFSEFIFTPINKLIILGYTVLMYTMIGAFFHYVPNKIAILLFVALPIPVLWLVYFSASGNNLATHLKSMKLGYTYYGRSLVFTCIILALYYLLTVLLNSYLTSFFFEYFNMHDGLSDYDDSLLLFVSSFGFLINVFVIPLITYLCLYLFISFSCELNGKDILLKLEVFGDEK